MAEDKPIVRDARKALLERLSRQPVIDIGRWSREELLRVPPDVEPRRASAKPREKRRRPAR
jgi:hypothetical protein